MMTKELFSIGERIKQLRENKGLTQAQLAKEFKLSRSAVNYWEMGLSVPSTQYIIELAKFFNVSADYLLGIKDTASISVFGLNEKQIAAVYEVIQCFKETNLQQTV